MSMFQAFKQIGKRNCFGLVTSNVVVFQCVLLPCLASGVCGHDQFEVRLLELPLQVHPGHNSHSSHSDRGHQIIPGISWEFEGKGE